MGTSFLTAVFIASAALAQVSSGQVDFRQAAWGMSAAQVMATERAKPSTVTDVKADTIVQYDAIGFAGLSGRLAYIFTKDKLVRVKLVFDGEHGEANEFIGDFRKVEAGLVERYGKPSSDRAVWLDDRTQLEPKSYLEQDRATATGIFPSDGNVGLAVSLGHLKLVTERAGGRTRVVHGLTGGDGRIVHQVEFSR